MSLDPRAQRLLHMLAASAGPPPTETAANRRAGLSSLTEMVGGPAPEMAAVQDISAPSPSGPIRIRRYQPADAAPGALVFVHGGGWAAGDLETHDGVCRRLAEACARPVFAVAYRLAPEHPFPAGLSDVTGAIDWITGQAAALGVDPHKLAVAGDSAGGNLVAAACLMRRDLGLSSAALQLLICPILDLAQESPSRLEFAEGYFLSRAALARDLADYAPGDVSDPRVSPLRAASLSGLPPTQIHVAEFDPFRDEALAFAGRLEAAGVPVSCTRHPGMIHYFYAMAGALPYAQTAFTAIGAGVRAALDR